MSKTGDIVLVTGGSGFIGRNIAEDLTGRYEVLAPGRRALDLLSQATVDDYFQSHTVDCVIHCANVGGNRKVAGMAETVRDNLRMFFNLCRNCDRFGKMIYFGSGAEYDRVRMPPYVHEEDFGTYIPSDDYGLAKYIMAKYAKRAENVYCLRLFSVYGPYEDYEFRFISNAIVKNLLHMPITISQNAYFDWLYVKDLTPIVERLIAMRPTTKTYNVTTGRTTDLLTIARLVNERSDYQSEIRIGKPGLNAEYSGSNERLLQEIGDVAFTPVEDGITKLISNYRERLGAIDAEIIRRDTYRPGVR